jgi:predicted membrane channel-forming protein YqfA (hemolysin III family)
MAMSRRAIILRGLASLLPLFTGMSGVVNGPSELPASITTMQRVVTYGVLAYGIAGLMLGMLVLVGFHLTLGPSTRRRRATLAVGNAWGLALVIAGTIAPVAFGEQSWLVGLVACVVTALVVAGALWLVRAAERASAPAAPAAPAVDAPR